MRFLDACFGRPVDSTPIWLMRQAGRYLPEYRALRDKASFLEICHNEDLAVEATLQPMRRYDLDAAIVFSDILIPIEAMGVEIDFGPDPRIRRPFRIRKDSEVIKPFDPGVATPFLLKTIERVRASLEPDKALIGFAGAPFTLATYLIDGGKTNDFVHTKTYMLRDPEGFRDLLKRLSDAIVPYLTAQIEAGADAVQVFDTWASALSPEDYRAFALPAVRSVVERVRERGVPVIYFATGVAPIMEDLVETGADVLGLDFRIDLEDAIGQIKGRASVQGNLDPMVLLGPEEEIRRRAREIVSKGFGARGHIFNLGHGVHRHTPPESVSILIDEVRRAGKRPSAEKTEP